MALDKTYLNVSDGNGDATLMHVATSRSIGGTTIEVDSVANVPAKFIASYGVALPNGFIDPATIVNFYGHLDGADLEIDGFCPGSADNGNEEGDLVVIKPNTAWADLIADFVQDAQTNIVAAALAAAYPVGSIYTNAVVATNPASLLGFGTWAAFGTGRVLVGIDGSQTEFDTIGETGGEKTHTLSSGEMPVHTHGVTDPGHQHNLFINTFNTFQSGGGTIVPERQPSFTPQNNWMTDSTTGITIQNAGSGGAHNNLQPYITVYMWKRTA